MRYEITVNRDHIDRKVGEPIRVTDTHTGHWQDYREVHILGDSVIRYGDARQNGATVWVECEHFEGNGT